MEHPIARTARRTGPSMLWLNLRVWATALVPTRAELRLGLLTGGVAFLAVVALSPLIGWLAR